MLFDIVDLLVLSVRFPTLKLLLVRASEPEAEAVPAASVVVHKCLQVVLLLSVHEVF